MFILPKDIKQEIVWLEHLKNQPSKESIKSGTFLGIIVMVGVFITATDTHWQISVPNNHVRLSSVVEFHQVSGSATLLTLKN